MKDTLYAIGEALIDFIPAEKGCAFSDVTAFSPQVGGAPANVCGAFSRLGGKSQMLTQLGDDPFGHKIRDELAGFGIGTEHISMTDRANTALAFVSLAADGNRTFSFYRNPSADMLYDPEQVRPEWFGNAFALHFCSVSLGDTPMCRAHRTAIDYALAAHTMVSFDPNLRFPLWPDREALYRAVWEFLPKAHVLKLSDEELAFVTGETDIQSALPKLFTGNVRLVVYTCGAGGAYAFTRKASAFAPTQKVQAVDTTGAGDAFIGSFLHSLYLYGVIDRTIDTLTDDELKKMLEFSNRYCGRSVQTKGAIASYPTWEEMEES